MVAELRKVPQYNEIYIEKDFNGFIRPYFNLHEKLDLLEGIVNKAKSIDVNAALPLYIDDFTDFENYKTKFQDQCLDLFIYKNKNKFFNYKINFKKENIKVLYASLQLENAFNYKLFLNNTDIIEVDIIAEFDRFVGFFSRCTNLKKIRGTIVKKTNQEGTIKRLFQFAFTNVENPDLSNFNVYDTKYADYVFAGSGIVDPSFFKYWKGIEECDEAFSFCQKIKKIDTKVFPSTIKKSFGFFAYCENLEKIIGNWNSTNSNLFEIPESMTFTSHMFSNCTNLKLVKNLKLPKGNNIEFFYRCKSLQEVYDLQLNGICTNMFVNCPINESWKIWLPTEIETSKIPVYNKDDFLGTCISHDKLKTFYIDINSVTIDGVQEPDIEKRKKQYEDLLNPNRDFIFKFINLSNPTPQEPPVTPSIVVSSDNGHCVFKNTAVYYK